MAIDDPAVTAERLRRHAGAAVGRAERARELALEIARRREMMGARVDRSLGEHVAAVWSSQAADRSRTVLGGDVVGALRLAADELDLTRARLAATATDFDDEARAHLRAAELLESVAPAPSEPIS